MTFEQVNQLHVLRVVVAARDHVTVTPVNVALQLPADGRLDPPIGVGDARFLKHRIDDVLIERPTPEDHVRGLRGPVVLRHAVAYHFLGAEDQAQREDTHGDGEHHQRRAEPVMGQIPPRLTPDDAHRQ